MESRLYELLVRKWQHERGLGTCYIARITDTNEMCNIRWLVTSKSAREAGLEHRLPPLKEDEASMENVYTLERFRRKGIQTASARQVEALARAQGFRRVVSQVAADNIPSLRSNRSRGHKVRERVLERHLLFRVTRRTLDRFDPPVPIIIPHEERQSLRNDHG